ncbi:MAG: DNA recombination protein RmuC, partial [Bacteroidales bacterium]|nr:DNA recombination protein RmuC [Bacteroidales bacterium]
METIVFIIIAFASVMAAVAIFMASRVVRLEKEKSALETRLQARGQYAEDLKRSHEEAMQRSAEQYRRDVELLKEQFRETMQRSAEQHQKEMEMMKDQFRVAAAEISEKNSREFKEQSAGRIEDILKPIKEKFSEFTKSMDDSRTSAVKMKTSLEEQIKNLMDQSGKVSDEARNLTNALTSRSKVQGDFGELILKDILVNAGLTEGLHFICQGVMTDRDGHEVKSNDGRTLIPDVLVLYPDDTLVVVDSKVSLTAYTAYCAAEAEDARDAAARQHVDSVRKHINELADKGYASYIPEGKRKV